MRSSQCTQGALDISQPCARHEVDLGMLKLYKFGNLQCHLPPTTFLSPAFAITRPDALRSDPFM